MFLLNLKSRARSVQFFYLHTLNLIYNAHGMDKEIFLKSQPRGLDSLTPLIYSQEQEQNNAGA